MDWLLKFVVLWLSFDVAIIATAWYATTVIKPQWSNWWRRVIVDADPTYHIISRESYQASALQILKKRSSLPAPTKRGD